jgi:hypothetical protein
MQIATGEIAEDAPETGKEYAREGGLIGGPARAVKLSKQRRSDIARQPAQTRWSQAKAETEAGGVSVFTVSKSHKTHAQTPKGRSRKS